jgi:hypothetical protein
MPTLSTILHEKRDDILTVMSLYNFNTDNVQILCHFHPDTLWGTFESDDFPHTLYFVAEGIAPKDMYNEEDAEHFVDRYSLEVRLSEILNCNIGITFPKDIQGIAWENLREHCAKISDDKKIAKLFNAPSLDNIEVKELDKNDKQFQHRQKLATRKPARTDEEKKSLEKKMTNNGHTIFKRKLGESDEFGYTPSPTGTTESDSDPEELVINKTIQGFKDSPVRTIDKVIEGLQKLKQMKVASSDEESDLKPKKQHTNKI